VLEIFADSIQNAQVTTEEMVEARNSLEFDLMNMSEKPEMLVSELVHQAAYGSKILGNSLICPRENVDRITRDMVLDFMGSFVTCDRLVISGAGMKHRDLARLVETHFGSLKSSSPVRRPRVPCRYYGGLVSFEEPSQKFTHLSLGFEGVSVHSLDFYALAIMQTLLGGGSSFSAGGPGKGMYSRLFLNVLNRYYWAESALSYNLSYMDSGLFGITGSAVPSQIDSLLRVFAQELLKLSENIESVEFTRAKNQLKSSLMMNLEQVGIQCEDIARQVLAFGKRYRPSELCEFIDRVTVEEARQAVHRVMKSRPSLAVYGGLEKVSKMEDMMKSLFG
jgi:processing peptidase subunit alpha